MNHRSFNWLLMALLLGNLALYFWPAAEDSELPAAMPAGIARLVMLSELPPGAQGVAMEEAPQLDTDAITFSGSAESASNEGEDEFAEIVSSPPAATEPAALPAEAPVPLSCWLVGPVGDPALQQRLETALAAAGLAMDLVLREVATDPDYWVHMPLQGSAAEKRALRSELRGKGLDNFHIKDGDLAGELSLGLFRSEARALGVMERVQQLGYRASIFERARSQEEVWVALDSEDLRLLDWPLQSGPLSIDPPLQLRARSCSSE